jgi:hypothetical protein
VKTSRLQADSFEEAGRALEPVAAKDSEQLLRAVSREQKADNQPQYEQT